MDVSYVSASRLYAYLEVGDFVLASKICDNYRATDINKVLTWLNSLPLEVPFYDYDPQHGAASAWGRIQSELLQNGVVDQDFIDQCWSAGFDCIGQAGVDVAAGGMIYPEYNPEGYPAIVSATLPMAVGIETRGVVMLAEGQLLANGFGPEAYAAIPPQPPKISAGLAHDGKPLVHGGFHLR